MRILVRQISGLGNQLFQYAAGRYYSRRFGADMQVAIDPPRRAVSHGYPRPFLLSNFSISSPFRTLDSCDRLILSQRAGFVHTVALLRRISGIQVITESHAGRYKFHRDLPLESNAHTIYLVGYWQAFQYADAIEEELRTEFTFREPPRGKNLEVLQRIRDTEHSISIHVRRGDYTLKAEGNIALPIDYYRGGIRFFKDLYSEPTFFVFSDDIDFAKQNLPRDARLVFVDHNDSFSAHEDMRLMSSCRCNVIANSSFSWWAAWLNQNVAKVVFSPRYWLLKPDSYFPDLLPPSWILSDCRG